MLSPEIVITSDRAVSLGVQTRVAWVDIAKGWCIVLVVTMHASLGFSLDPGPTGWLHSVVAFAKPFRMPDFFMIAGLFASTALRLSWRIYLDRKVVHFAYFYMLWLGIVLLAKAQTLDIASPAAFANAYLTGLVEPFSTLWFIQLLPLLFVSVRLVNRDTLAGVLFFAVSMHLLAALFPEGGVYTMSSGLTRWSTFNNFSLYFIYFLAGVLLRKQIFSFASASAARPVHTVSGLVIWGAIEAWAVYNGLPQIPGLTLLFGFAGAFAIVAGSSLLARFNLMRALAYCGQRSLYIYLSFVLPMGFARIAILKSGLISNVGWMSLIDVAIAIGASLALYELTAHSWLAFLFKRPAFVRMPEWPALGAGWSGAARNQHQELGSRVLR